MIYRFNSRLLINWMPQSRGKTPRNSRRRMASFLAPYGNRDALEVARNLDKKIEDLLRKAAA